VDALALGVAAGGVELPVVVLLRVAGHLRRRPRPHREPRDVAPVPAPVLLQPPKKQPAHATDGVNFFKYKGNGKNNKAATCGWRAGPTRQLGGTPWLAMREGVETPTGLERPPE